jgi:hypothetical protein
MLYILFIFHISAFFFIFYSQVSHSFRSTLLTPSWQSAMQGMEEEENQDDGFRSPMKRCTSQPPWADQTDVSWCQLMSVVSAMYNQVTFKSHSNQFNSKHRARYGWWRSKFEVIQSEISYKMYQNVAHLFKSARLEGSLKVVVCCSHAFVKYSQHFSAISEAAFPEQCGTSQQRSLQPRETISSHRNLSATRPCQHNGANLMEVHCST